MPMRTRNPLKTIGALVLGVVLAFDANAIIAFDSSASPANINGPWNLGLGFHLSQDVTVTSLGTFHTGVWNAGDSVQVAIYNMSGVMQGLGGGTVVTFSSAAQGVVRGGGSFAFQDLSNPFTLTAGDYMIVARDTANAYFYTGPGISYDSSLTFTGNYLTNGSAGLAFIDQAPISTANPTWGAGSFEFAPVPEATTFGVAAVGLLGLVYVGRYVRLRWRMKHA